MKSILWDEYVEHAMRQVIFRAMKNVKTDGIPMGGAFYISFDHTKNGVVVPEHLKENYGNPLVIVLQNQYYELKVDERGFGVTLYFHGVAGDIFVTYNSILEFIHPEANFSVKFPKALNDDTPALPEKTVDGNVVKLTDWRKK